MKTMVLSETWLKKSVSNNSGYMVRKRNRGVAIYVKSKLNISEILSMTKAKHFELLAVKVNVQLKSKVYRHLGWSH
jgi:hypothetical protein